MPLGPESVQLSRRGGVLLTGSADADAFLVALSGRAEYDVQYLNCRWLNGDCNSDGGVHFADIDPFVVLLRA